MAYRSVLTIFVTICILLLLREILALSCTPDHCLGGTVCRENDLNCSCPPREQQEFCSLLSSLNVSEAPDFNCTIDDCLTNRTCTTEQDEPCSCPLLVRTSFCSHLDDQVILGAFNCTPQDCNLTSSSSCPSHAKDIYCRHLAKESCDIECLNGGTCHMGACQCMYGFSGDQCEIPPGEPCANHYCYHGGTCNHTLVRLTMDKSPDVISSGDGPPIMAQLLMDSDTPQFCVCQEQLTGPFCQLPKCPVCENGGECQGAQCQCPLEYGGQQCQIKVQTCTNISSCSRNSTTANISCTNSTECECSQGFFGENCKHTKCSIHCFNGGECLDGICVCRPGFAGLYCEQVAVPCLYQACVNGGQCHNDACLCPEGFAGRSCEKDVSCTNCSYFSFCIKGMCACPAAIGMHESCDEYFESCQANIPCLHGVCNGLSCECSPGYYGVSCERQQCDPPCQNGGLCENGRCMCDVFSGISGDQCQNVAGEACGDLHCLFGGRCNATSRECLCGEGYGGPHCRERTCSPSCQNGGSCHVGHCICTDGFEGPDCRQEASPCGSLYCYNGGQCHSNATQCRCTPGYSGPSCTLRLCDSHCFNGGQCANGACQCPDGYAGLYCEKLGTECGRSHCYNGGRCALNTLCVCPMGFQGPQCLQEVCRDSCPHYGTCFEGKCDCPDTASSDDRCDHYYTACPWDIHCLNRATCANRSCLCPPQFTGLRCEQINCYAECLNGGFCHKGKCKCPYGYSGDLCQRTPGEACGEGHCFNSAPCNETAGSCVCPPQLSGTYCNVKNCYPECENGGVCTSTESYASCDCPPNFGGLQCEQDLTRCGEHYCMNEGQCVDGQCACSPEFSGLYCQIPLCNVTCQNGGTCMSSFCECPKGYGGLYCEQEYTSCRGVRCGNNGYCVKDMCVCLPGYTGPSCETEICSSSCPYYGTCAFQQCYCPNYTKTDNQCDHYYNTCSYTICLNNGSCDGRTCICAPGYFGIHCETEICSVECLNGGTCHFGRCDCMEGWKGERCHIRAGIVVRQFTKDPDLQTQSCPLEVASGDDGLFEWPETRAGGVARLPCPCESNPTLTTAIFALRKCSWRGEWDEPDWQTCRLSDRIQKLCTADKRDLLNVVKNVSAGRQSGDSELSTADVALLASAVDALSAAAENINDEETRDELLTVVDDLLSVDEDVLKETSETSDTSTKIVGVFEKIADLIQLIRGGKLRVEKHNFLLEVEDTKIDDIPEEGFEPDFYGSKRIKAILPKSLFSGLGGDGENLRVSSSVIDAPTLFRGRNESVSVTGPVISIAVVGQSVSGLDEPIKLTFDKANFTALKKGWLRDCVFWNESLDDGLGAWSNKGCHVAEETDEYIECACNHLTTFAAVEVPNDNLCLTCLLGGVAEIVVPVVITAVTLTSVLALVVLVVIMSIVKKKRPPPPLPVHPLELNVITPGS